MVCSRRLGVTRTRLPERDQLHRDDLPYLAAPWAAYSIRKNPHETMKKQKTPATREKFTLKTRKLKVDYNLALHSLFLLIDQITMLTFPADRRISLAIFFHHNTPPSTSRTWQLHRCIGVAAAAFNVVPILAIQADELVSLSTRLAAKQNLFHGGLSMGHLRRNHIAGWHSFLNRRWH